MYLISIEKEKIEIEINGIFKDCSDIFNDENIEYEINFSSNIIKKYIEFNKNNDTKLKMDEYIELLMLADQYFESDFEKLCKKFDIFKWQLNDEYLDKISVIFKQISKYINYYLNYETFLEKISKIIKNLNINKIKFLCNNIVDYILIFAVNNDVILNNINLFTSLSDDKGPYYKLHKISHQKIIYANNIKQFICQIYRVYVDNIKPKFYKQDYNMLQMNKKYLIPIFKSIFKEEFKKEWHNSLKYHYIYNDNDFIRLLNKYA